MRQLKRRSILIFTCSFLIIVSIITAAFLKGDSIQASNNQLTSMYEPIYMTEKTNDKLSIEFAEKLLKNELIVNEKISDIVEYDINNIDWNVNATTSPNTFSLYLQTLRPIYYLSRAYLATNDIRYLNYADKFVDSWVDYEKSSESLNRYTWYDHTVAERTENLIYYYIVKQTAGDPSLDEKIKQTIKESAEWLFFDDNYTPKHNHGIFQDGSLIKAGYFLNENKYIEKGVARLDEQLKYAFPNKHIHIENSIGYHLGIISYIKEVAGFLSHFDNEFSETATMYYKGAVEYLAYAYKPNITLPFIGDTLGASGISSVGSDFDDENLKYALSQGSRGITPKENLKVYLSDGTALYREHWSPGEFNQATWILFKSGFLSSTHKHADDLSFLLYSKGHDIFIDPGMFNYMVGNKMHDYMNSNFAHNTVIVDDKSYSISMFNSNKVGLYSYDKNDGYESVTGFNNIFNGVNIDRTINYIDGDNFLIVDDIKSKESHKYSQVFHLSNEVEIEKLTTNGMILKIKDTDYHVVLQQLNPVDKVSKFSGTNDVNHLSFISAGLNKSIPTTTIVFDRNATSSQFITYVKIVKTGDLNNFTKAIKDGEIVRINNIQINTTGRERLPDSKVSVKVKDSRLEVINSATSVEQKLSYAFYLLDKETGKKYDSKSYSFDPHAQFTLEKGKSYALISYLRNNAKETSKRLIGFVEYDGKMFVYKNVSDQEQEPMVKGESYYKVSDGVYNFKVDISGTNELAAKWYIYKDGASYDFIGNNSNELIYHFTELGNYTCIYRINDKYFGEFEYNNFEEIQIVE